MTELTPLIAFVLVLVIGAAMRPAPLPRTIETVATFETVEAGMPSHLPAPRRRATVDARRVGRNIQSALTRKRHPPASAQDAADWCDELARALRSGATLSGAVRASSTPRSIAPLAEQLRLALDRGQPIGEALHLCAASTPGSRSPHGASPHVTLVLTVLRACAEQGGPAAEPLDRKAATLRTRAADHADRLTQSAQARMSAMVMTCLPVAMLALMMFTSASVRAAIVSPVGFAAVAMGATLNAAGWLWMQRTIAGAKS